MGTEVRDQRGVFHPMQVEPSLKAEAPPKKAQNPLVNPRLE